jgi:hypothetical protein
MRRWSTFLFGVAVGGLIIYGVLNYHVIHARDGMHLVPKVDAQLAGTYVDIREFTLRDWANHLEIVAALRAAKRDDLLEMSADDTADRLLDRVLGAAPKER